MRERAAALSTLLIVGLACTPALHELNLAMREGLPYRPPIVHPVFPDDGDPDSLLTALQGTWNELEALLTPSELEALCHVSSPGALSAWRAAFWAQRDPVPTTPTNERRLEHERRLAEAQRRFSRPTPPFYDARGRLFILGGEPDAVLVGEADVSGSSYEPPVEVWRMDDRLFAFQSFANSGVFTPSGMDSAREALFIALAGSPRDMMVMLARAEEARDSAHLERFRYEPAGPRLPIAVSADFYRAPAVRGGGTLLRLYYAFSSEGLCARVDSASGDYRWQFREACALVGPGQRRLDASSSRDWWLPVPSWQGTTAITGLIEQVLSPDDYFLTVQILDRSGPAEALHQDSLRVPAFAPDSLAISDLSLFRADAGPENLQRPGRPAPSHCFRRGESIALVCEIYGLGQGPGKAHHFSLRTAIRAGGRASATTTISQHGRGDQAEISFVLDTGGLDPGDYWLSLDVVDEERRLWSIDPARARASRSRLFTVLPLAKAGD
jgi:GWxTD domain-containing protein